MRTVQASPERYLLTRRRDKTLRIGVRLDKVSVRKWKLVLRVFFLRRHEILPVPVIFVSTALKI